MALEELRAGEPCIPFSAETWNRMIAATRWVEGVQRGAGGGALRGVLDTALVRVRNDHDEDLPRFAVLGLGEVVIDPADNFGNFVEQPCFAGQTPAAEHGSRFVVLLEPLAVGRIGRAIASGVVAGVLLDVADEGHQFATLIDADPSMLRSATSGLARILWKESGTGSGLVAAVSLETVADAGLKIKNDNAAELPAYGLAYAKSYESSSGAVLVDKLGSTFKRDVIINGATAIAAGEYGYAQRGPLVTVAYDTGTPAVGDGYGPKASQWTATKNYPSVLTSLGVVDSSSKWMLARLEPPSFLIGQLEADCDKGASGTVYLLESDDSTEDKITDWSVTAINLFGDIEAGTGSGSGVTKPAKVALNWINGKWYMVAGDCKPGVA